MTKIKNGVSTEYVDQIRKEMTKMGMSKDSQDRAIQAQWGLLGAAMRESQPIDKVAKMLYAIKNSSFKTGCMKAENAISAKLKNAGIKNARIDIKCTYADGDTIVTGFNGTLKEAEDYFVGKYFNLGDGAGGDKMVKCLKIEQLT
jgi:hypothetical protein